MQPLQQISAIVFSAMLIIGVNPGTIAQPPSVQWALDPGFGNGGVVQLPGSEINTTQFVQRPDGQLVGLVRQYEVTRFGYRPIVSTAYLVNTSGSIVTARELWPFAKAVQSDNMLLLGEARYNASLVNVDPDFFARGEASFPESFHSNHYFVQGDDKILITGQQTAIISSTVDNDLQLRRLNSDGSVDEIFGAVTFSNTSPFGVAGYDPRGRIVVAGDQVPQVDRVYSITGTLLGLLTSPMDSSFGSYFTSWYTPDPSGDFVWFATPATSPPSRVGHIYRSKGNSGLDSTFGGNGIFTITLPSNLSWVYDNFVVLVKADRGVVLVGQVYDSSAHAARIFVVGINADGTPDLNFGPQGLFFVQPGINFAQINYEDIRVMPLWHRSQAVFLTSDQKIVIAGVKTSQLDSHPTIIRLAPFVVRGISYLPVVSHDSLYQ